MVSTPSRRKAADDPGDTMLDRRPVVLVVHSSPALRHALFVTLDLDGFDVLVTGDATEATLMLTTMQPEVVIADLSMASEVDGELLRRMRSDASMAHVPLILISRLLDRSPVGEWSVNGVHHVSSGDGVGGLLHVLHELVGPRT